MVQHGRFLAEFSFFVQPINLTRLCIGSELILSLIHSWTLIIIFQMDIWIPLFIKLLTVKHSNIYINFFGHLMESFPLCQVCLLYFKIIILIDLV